MILFALFLGCDSKCARNLTAIQVWAEAVIADLAYPPYEGVPSTADLVLASGNHRPPAATALAISDAMLQIDEQETTIQTLKQTLLREREKLADLQPTLEQEVRPEHILIAVDKHVQWGRLLDIVEIVESAEYFRITFVFARTRRTASPAEINDASVPSDAFSQCPTLQTIVANRPPVANSPPDQTHNKTIGRIAKSVGICKCSDLPAIHATLWKSYPTTPQWGVTVLLSDGNDAPALTISAPAQAPWETVAQQFIQLDTGLPYRVKLARTP